MEKEQEHKKEMKEIIENNRELKARIKTIFREQQNLDTKSDKSGLTNHTNIEKELMRAQTQNTAVPRHQKHPSYI